MMSRMRGNRAAAIAGAACVLLALAIAIWLFGDRDDGYPWPIGPASPILDVNTAILLTIEESGITRYGITFTTVNTGPHGYGYHYDGHFFLQILHNGTWHEIEDRYVFDNMPRRLPQTGLRPRESKTYSFSWSHDMYWRDGVVRSWYGELPNGTYRIAVQFYDTSLGWETRHPRYVYTYAIHEFHVTDEHARR